MKIKVLVGSTRPNRFSIQVADWIMQSSVNRVDTQYELVDLAEVNLPLFDEPQPPSMAPPTNEHTRRWAKIIDDADGFIFVTPEYNHSYPAALKNAIDYLSKEWNYKPLAFVSYGAEAGGTRAIEQLRSIAGQLKMYDLNAQVTIPNYWAQLDDKGIFTANDKQEAALNSLFESLEFWTGTFVEARKKLK